MSTTSKVRVTPMGELILILGGARSGKSALAERLARSRGDDSVTYVATGQALDQEMKDRISRHQAARPNGWLTLEAPLDAADAVSRSTTAVVLFDCLTLLVSNLLLSLGDPEAGEAIAGDRLAEARVDQQLSALIVATQEHKGLTIVVSNEVGQGLVPPYALGRLYRDLLGRANRRLASAADAVYWVVAGLPLDLKRLNALPELFDDGLEA